MHGVQPNHPYKAVRKIQNLIAVEIARFTDYYSKNRALKLKSFHITSSSSSSGIYGRVDLLQIATNKTVDWGGGGAHWGVLGLPCDDDGDERLLLLPK